jgi:NAD(P)-dependent dehydrogenase (short-subunit alcohol dehydrogenase family)
MARRLIKNGKKSEEKSMGKLEGKIALVTGGNDSVGLATAKQFVNEGAYVFITGDRDADLVAAVKEIGRNVVGVQAEASNLGDLDRLFAQIKREKGKLHVVFANAAAEKYAPLGKVTEEDYHLNFYINVKGLFFTVQRALPLLQDGASIIVNASAVANKGLGGAKNAAMRSFARTWARDLEDRRIRVNAVSQDPIETRRLNDPIASRGTAEQRLRHGRPSTPEQIAKAVVSLSDGSSDITGMELFMDGGLADLKALSNDVPPGRRATPSEIADAAVFLASDDSSHITGMEWFVGTGFEEL